jgi:hypothetical protein
MPWAERTGQRTIPPRRKRMNAISGMGNEETRTFRKTSLMD